MACRLPETCNKKCHCPRITWGRYRETESGRIMMPVSILAHHALVDGEHIAQFYANLEQEIKKFVSE